MLYIFYVECHDKMPINKRYNAYSVVVTHGKQPRVDFAFARQPWAIKGTTPTALRGEAFVRMIWLIIKRKKSCDKWVHNLLLFTA